MTTTGTLAGKTILMSPETILMPSPEQAPSAPPRSAAHSASSRANHSAITAHSRLQGPCPAANQAVIAAEVLHRAGLEATRGGGYQIRKFPDLARI